MVASGQRHAPALTPRMTRYRPYRRLGGPRNRFGPVRKLSPSPEFNPRTIKLIARRYTDWAIVAHNPIFVLIISQHR